MTISMPQSPISAVAAPMRASARLSTARPAPRREAWGRDGARGGRDDGGPHPTRRVALTLGCAACRRRGEVARGLRPDGVDADEPGLPELPHAHILPAPGRR